MLLLRVLEGDGILVALVAWGSSSGSSDAFSSSDMLANHFGSCNYCHIQERCPSNPPFPSFNDNDFMPTQPQIPHSLHTTLLLLSSTCTLSHLPRELTLNQNH